MSGGIQFIDNTEEVRKRYQYMARMKMIVRLEQDILMDMAICDIEGWDKREYLKMLKEKIDELGGGCDE